MVRAVPVSCLLAIGLFGLAGSFLSKPAIEPDLTASQNHPIVDDGSEQPTAEQFAELAAHDPVGMLEQAVRRYRADVQTVHCELEKQERIAGTLHPVESLSLLVRESPYAVRMLWHQGARSAKLGGISLGKVEGAIYSAGENDGHMLVWRPGAWLSPVSRASPTGDPARAASRYAIVEAGPGHILERTRKAWTEARDRSALQWDYLGELSVDKLDGRLCHVIRRQCTPPEVDPFLACEPPAAAKPNDPNAFATITIMIDSETWLQIGTEQYAENGELVGAYYFRNVELNRPIATDAFQQSAFQKQ